MAAAVIAGLFHQFFLKLKKLPNFMVVKRGMQRTRFVRNMGLLPPFHNDRLH